MQSGQVFWWEGTNGLADAVGRALSDFGTGCVRMRIWILEEVGLPAMETGSGGLRNCCWQRILSSGWACFGFGVSRVGWRIWMLGGLWLPGLET